MRRFEPKPQGWRTFDVTTTVQIKAASGATRVWLPVASLDTPWQRTVDVSYSSEGANLELLRDKATGAATLVASFAADSAQPTVTLVNRVQTQNRAADWSQRRPAVTEDAAELRRWTEASELITTDGIVRKVATQIVSGARTDQEKAQRIFDWVVISTYREPKVRGCGVGDIKTMLETESLSGKCADINSLFVGLCRAVGIPARDIYGIRLVPSAFGYRELGGNPANLKGAQHCRAVCVQHHGQGHAGSGHKAAHGVRRLAEVHGKYLQTRLGVTRCEALQRWHLGPAGFAPTGPEVEHDGLSGLFRQFPRLAVQRGQGQSRLWLLARPGLRFGCIGERCGYADRRCQREPFTACDCG